MADTALPSGSAYSCVPDQPCNAPIKEQKTLFDWHHLPDELQTYIWDLACRRRSTGSHDEELPSPLDMDTTINVACVSQERYRATLDMLYKRVSLQRPSQLKLFHQTLAARPNLGLLVEALHVGPLYGLEEDIWPVCQANRYYGSQRLLFAVSRLDDPLKPWSSSAREQIHVPSTAEDTSSQAKWVSEAIVSASRALDVNIHGINYDYAGRNIGSDAWHVRLFEVQAAVELLLIEIGRREQGNDGERKEDSSYPRLVVGNSSIKPGEDVLRVSRSQIRDQLTRRGAKTDHFAHPVIFARSGAPWSYNHEGKLLEGGSADNIVRGGERDVADSFRLLPTFEQIIREEYAEDVCDDLTFPLPPTATLGGLYGLARSVLAFTPNLQSLSLTGFLERVLFGSRAPPALKALRSVTVGPRPQHWPHPLFLRHHALMGIEKLRIAGYVLHASEIACITGHVGMLSQLKEFTWSLGSKYSEDSPLSLIETIKRLCKLDESSLTVATEAAARRSRKRARRDNDDYDDASDSGEESEGSQGPRARDGLRVHWNNRPHHLSIKVVLGPEDARAVLDAAPSEEMREAWREGGPMPGSAVGDRMHVVVDLRFGDAKLDRATEMVLLEQGMEWWHTGVKRAAEEEEEEHEIEEEEGAAGEESGNEE